MPSHALTPHRGGAQLDAIRATTASVELAERTTSLRFTYVVAGELAAMAVPRFSPSRRAERLWEHTCFEAFVAPDGGERYCELNFSPSTQWAAYAFDGYRRGMRPLELRAAPRIAVVESAAELRVTACVELDALEGARWPWRIGLSAVLEDRSGSRAYFALRHPREQPDFHDAAAFVVTVDGSTR